MESTEHFQLAVEKLLEAEAFRSPLFAKTLQKPNKNLTDCCTYILNAVKQSKKNGVTDDEVLKLAMHYFDEDKIKVGGPIKAMVITNQEVKLTEEEIEKAKKEAYDQVIQEERDRLKGKTKKPLKTEDKPKQENTLF